VHLTTVAAQMDAAASDVGAMVCSFSAYIIFGLALVEHNSNYSLLLLITCVLFGVWNTVEFCCVTGCCWSEESSGVPQNHSENWCCWHRQFNCKTSASASCCCCYCIHNWLSAYCCQVFTRQLYHLVDRYICIFILMNIADDEGSWNATRPRVGKLLCGGSHWLLNVRLAPSIQFAWFFNHDSTMPSSDIYLTEPILNWATRDKPVVIA